MINKKIADLAPFILALFNNYQEVNLANVIKAAGLSINDAADRRAIQRAFAKLVKEGSIQTKGSGRARTYLLKTNAYLADDNLFQNIKLSDESQNLLQYLTQPINSRTPVGYNQNFLRSYEPNHTQYLSSALREELLAVGKVENIARPAGTYARNILNRLLIDLSWNSSRLEGNTYSLLETKRLIEFGENALGKNATESQMILNHKDAIEYIIESASETKISSHVIRSIHALLSENLLGDPSASGRIREIAVGISGTTYIPLENPHLLKECSDEFVKKLNLISDPFEQSFFAFVQLSYLQAFEDVNKRTARLVANIPFVKKNLKPLSFIDVKQQDYVLSLLGVYEKNDVTLLRDLYVWAYKRSASRYSAIQQSIGEPNQFKLRYRNVIHDIVRKIILENTSSAQVVPEIKRMIDSLNLSEIDASQLFQIIEIEIMSLHDGNIARFKIKPSEFMKWKQLSS